MFDVAADATSHKAETYWHKGDDALARSPEEWAATVRGGLGMAQSGSEGLMAAKQLDLCARRFVDAYLGSANGNGTEACRQAGYAGTTPVLGVQATRLLKKASVRKAIDARQNRASAKAILSADERDQMLTSIARMHWKGLHVAMAVRAIAELNRVTGRHSIKHVLDGKLTLEQALDASRTMQP